MGVSAQQCLSERKPPVCRASTSRLLFLRTSCVKSHFCRLDKTYESACRQIRRPNQAVPVQFKVGDSPKQKVCTRLLDVNPWTCLGTRQTCQQSSGTTKCVAKQQAGVTQAKPRCADSRCLGKHACAHKVRWPTHRRCWLSEKEQNLS